MSEIKFPIGATLDGGRIEIASTLAGNIMPAIYWARTKDGEARTLLVTLADPQKASMAELRRRYGRRMPGGFKLEHLGPAERPSGMEKTKSRAYQWCPNDALVEQPTPGLPLKHLVGSNTTLRSAIKLAGYVGKLFLDALAAGYVPSRVRPEMIFGTKETGELVPTGFSDRYASFFRSAKKPCIWIQPPFERSYLAPEAHEQEASERSVCFSLAVMTVEWATGKYPFPDCYYGLKYDSLFLGRHMPLALPAELARLLSSCLQPDPRARPPLSELVEFLVERGPEEAPLPRRL